MNIETVLSDLECDEGFSPVAYQDHLGYWTIGYGTLVDKRKGGGITQDEGRYLLRNRLAVILSRLDQLRPAWRTYPDDVQHALANMAYQLGAVGLHEFENMWSRLNERDYEGAAKAALDSRWAHQTPKRAARVAAMIRSASETA